LKKIDEKIFFNLRLFFGAGLINMLERINKTISDVKKFDVSHFLNENEIVSESKIVKRWR
jgi:hypothetical protein